MLFRNAIVALLAGTALAIVENRDIIDYGAIRAAQGQLYSLQGVLQNIYQVAGSQAVRDVAGQVNQGGSVEKLNDAAGQAQSAINAINGALGQYITEYQQNEAPLAEVWS